MDSGAFNPQKGRIFVFGYGSLCYPQGVNGRGMKRTYQWKDLVPARLKGYVRGWFAHIQGYAYYGIVPASPEDEVNGVVFQISPRDLRALNESEMVGIVYYLKNVRKKLSLYPKWESKSPFGLKKDSVVYAYVCKQQKPKKTTVKAPSYEQNVKKGISHWGLDFL